MTVDRSKTGGHSDIKGNEIADELGKEASEQATKSVQWDGYSIWFYVCFQDIGKDETVREVKLVRERGRSL